MISTTTASLTPPVEPAGFKVLKENPELSYSFSTWNNNKDNLLIDPKISEGSDSEIKTKSTKYYSSTKTADKTISARISDAWLSSLITIFNSDDTKWLHKAITKSERYLMPLYDQTEPRLMIASMLLILRNNASVLGPDSETKAQLKNILGAYSDSSQLAKDRMIFLRNTRRIGLSLHGS